MDCVQPRMRKSDGLGEESMHDIAGRVTYQGEDLAESPKDEGDSNEKHGGQPRIAFAMPDAITKFKRPSRVKSRITSDAQAMRGS